MLWTKHWSGHWCLDLFADIKVCSINLMKRANAHICQVTIPLSWFYQLDVPSQKPPTLIPQIMRKYYSFITTASRFNFGFITVPRLIRKHLHRLWAFWMEVGRTAGVSASHWTHWGLGSSLLCTIQSCFLNSWIWIEVAFEFEYTQVLKWSEICTRVRHILFTTCLSKNIVLILFLHLNLTYP